MIRVADYIADTISRFGVTQVFMVTGGGAMHLNDAFSRHKGLQTLCMHHEQACAMAAEGYARVMGKMALVNVTTGPGGLNALNGVFGAYTDSVPMLVVSGQVKRETFVGNQPLSLRQLGDQEVDICAVVRPIVKYASILNDPADARYEIEKAIWIAEHGRPGPVWVDVPVDVQGALVKPSDLRAFDSSCEEAFLNGATTGNETGAVSGEALEREAASVLEAIRKAARPIILAGSGVWAAGAVDEFRDLILRLGLPVTTAFNAHDLLHDEHPLFVGRPGTIGDRGGNFSIQNADLVIVLGCRLNIRQISYNYESFARNAKKIMVDIDAAELEKHTLSIDWPIHADLKAFIESLRIASRDHAPNETHDWFLGWCKERRKRYPVVLPQYFERKSPVNPYAFAKLLFDELAQDDIIVAANATACIVTFQCARLREGQRLFSNSGSASMGFDLPAAIGACVAAGGKRVICLAGDGSIMMNLQELQTIIGANLPIKIFLLNNNGYHSILQTQTAFFGDNIFGCNPSSGVSFPDFERVGAAFGFAIEKCDHLDLARSAILNTLDASGPVLCHVSLDPSQPFAPKLSSRRLEDGRMISASLEDMAPFLPRDEFASNMLNLGDE